MASLRYTHGIVCRVPLSFRSQGEINFEEAKRQHEAYVRLLRDIGLDVIELPPDETLPECIYVEDTAVVCNGIALITRPGNPSRQKEVISKKILLAKRRFGIFFNLLSDNWNQIKPNLANFDSIFIDVLLLSCGVW